MVVLVLRVTARLHPFRAVVIRVTASITAGLLLDPVITLRPALRLQVVADIVAILLVPVITLPLALLLQVIANITGLPWEQVTTPLQGQVITPLQDQVTTTLPDQVIIQRQALTIRTRLRAILGLVLLARANNIAVLPLLPNQVTTPHPIPTTRTRLRTIQTLVLQVKASPTVLL